MGCHMDLRHQEHLNLGKIPLRFIKFMFLEYYPQTPRTKSPHAPLGLVVILCTLFRDVGLSSEKKERNLCKNSTR